MVGDGQGGGNRRARSVGACGECRRPEGATGEDGVEKKTEGHGSALVTGQGNGWLYSMDFEINFRCLMTWLMRVSLTVSRSIIIERNMNREFLGQLSCFSILPPFYGHCWPPSSPHRLPSDNDSSSSKTLHVFRSCTTVTLSCPISLICTSLGLYHRRPLLSAVAYRYPRPASSPSRSNYPSTSSRGTKAVIRIHPIVGNDARWTDWR